MEPTRRLLLLRHARAEHGGVDHERPLTLEGRRQAAAVGAALAGDGTVPGLVLCSSALRTRQTWDLVRGGLGRVGADAVVRVLDELYDAGPTRLVELLQVVPDETVTVLVVGHEPVMSVTASRLAGSASSPDVVERVQHGVPTASWSVLEPDGPWSALDRGRARLRALRLAAV